MYKTIIIYRATNKYAQEVTDFFNAVELRVPSEDRLFIDNDIKPAHEILDYLKKEFKFTKSEYIDSKKVSKDPIYIFVRPGFADNFIVEEKWITKDIAKEMIPQFLDKYYPIEKTPVVTPPVVKPPVNSPESNSKFLWIAAAVIGALFIFKK